ncbi:MAG: carbamoyltransferase C-terminal domain-containing protein [Myxococcota bacterium]|nr:carbamoyltransferase C-terminal domain-containing protein [Myxococcota bacterium]
MTTILGINGSTLRDGLFRRFGGMHNASACLLVDGELEAFVEEERFTHVKQFGGFPAQSIRYCLESQGLSIEEVDHVAYGWMNIPGLVWNRLSTYVRSGLAFKTEYPLGVLTIDALELVAGGLERAFKKHFGSYVPPITCIHHHRCHAASSFRCSGFDEATLVNFDGAGETTATYIGHGRGNEIETLREISVPHSLGRAYSEFTEYLGFVRNNDEYKVMGLASYGEPEFDLSEIIRDTSDGYELDPKYFYRYSIPQGRFRVDALEALCGPRRVDDDAPIDQRHKNVAASIQRRLEDVSRHLVERAVEQTGSRNLCLAGGVALNCKNNGELLQSGLVDGLFVQPVANDAGVALGAALELNARLGNETKWKMEHTYYGPEVSEEAIEEALDRAGLDYACSDDVESETAAELAAGKIVGWFQGRAEVGPRALGNRSILGNPKIPGMDDRINEIIKFREAWRPFCPSILDEAKDDYLVGAKDSPFMILTFEVEPERREEVPAVVHVDGTARPHTVKRDVNPRYWKLIESFRQETGTPVLMNTSFNIKGDTIVNTVDDAVRTFRETGMDVLVVGDFVVRASAQR